MERLSEKHFAFKCPMNWDEMEVSGNARHCCKCRKQVFDLSDCSIDEVIALQRKHGAICGSIKVATVAVSLAAAACGNAPDGPLTSGDQAISRRQSIAGVICPPEMLEKTKQP